MYCVHRRIEAGVLRISHIHKAVLSAVLRHPAPDRGVGDLEPERRVRVHRAEHSFVYVGNPENARFKPTWMKTPHHRSNSSE
jgi:hypothetical protein